MENLLDILVTIVSALILGAYLWSMRAHFVTDNMPKGARVISAVVTLSALFLLYLTWFFTQPIWAQIAGLVLQLLSAALFFAAIRASRAARLKFVFDSKVPETLVDTGPYRFIRHPFYVSYVIFWAGWAVATWSPFSLICVLALTTLYVRAARGEERSFADTPMAEAYAAYSARTGFFWPRLG